MEYLSYRKKALISKDFLAESGKIFEIFCYSRHSVATPISSKIVYNRSHNQIHRSDLTPLDFLEIWSKIAGHKKPDR